MLRPNAIQDFIESHGGGRQGAEQYLRMQAKLLGLNEDGSVPRDENDRVTLNESARFPDGTEVRRKSPSRFSLKALWEGLVGPTRDTLNYFRDAPGAVSLNEIAPSGLRESVGTGAFSAATGQLIASQVIEAYEMTEGFIGDQLVQTMPSSLRGEPVVGFTAAMGPAEVAEHEPYPQASFAEKKVGTRETKRGRIIEVTEELVAFDQTGQVLERARMIGEAARQDRERRIVQGVIDHDSSNAIWQPDESSEQLYQSSNNNVDTSTGSLQDFTDIQSVMQFHANNITDDRHEDDETSQQPLVWNPRILLTAVELMQTAQSIVNATEVRQQIGSNEHIMGNPNASITPLSSPFIDNATGGDQWDDNSDWLLGDFQKQFRYKEIWPLQTMRAPSNDDQQFSRDVVARFKVREYGDVFAQDERFVVKVDVA